MSLRSDFVKTTIEEATEKADAILKTRDCTMFVRVVEDGDEWTYEALQTTSFPGRLATVAGFPDSARDTREEAIERIDTVTKKYAATRIK